VRAAVEIASQEALGVEILPAMGNAFGIPGYCNLVSESCKFDFILREMIFERADGYVYSAEILRALLHWQFR
jgi:hypothetical protein